MKNKMLYGLILVLSVFLLAGCGAKETLTCDNTQEISGFKIQDHNLLQLEGTKVVKFTEEMTTTTSTNEAKAGLKSYSESIESQFSNLYNKKGITVTSEVDEDKHIFKVEVIYDEIDMDELNNLTDEEKVFVKDYNKKISITKTKEDSESKGYTCTIK